jgi:hypothetical protein
MLNLKEFVNVAQVLGNTEDAETYPFEQVSVLTEVHMQLCLMP